MPRSWTSTRALLWSTIAAACLAGPARAQLDALSSDGIDLVFLVDVSGSMFTGDPRTPESATGNDPQRIRWDAVLLATNLLTATDSFVVFPFNHRVPARRYQSEVYIPGQLDRAFMKARSPEGMTARSRISRFVHEKPWEPSTPGEFNGDEGGTALLAAIDHARTFLKNSNRDSSHPCFIIMLTDGGESPDSEKPPGLEGLRKPPNSGMVLNGLESDPLVKGWMRTLAADLKAANAKVYTMGLGNGAQHGLLSLIAGETKGHYEHVENNKVLIDKFRDLIWQLKGCWIKHRDLRKLGRDREPDKMARIFDFGMLTYKYVEGHAPRVYEKLTPPEELRIAPPEVARRMARTEERSYAYSRYEAADGPGGLVDVETSWAAADTDRQVDFSKRTIKRLFEVIPFESRWSSRYVKIPIRVRMKERTLGFEPAMFELKVKVQTPEGPGRPAKVILPEALLSFDSRDGVFVREIDLTDLESEGGEFDTYEFIVTASGKATVDHFSLKEYTLEFPPIDRVVANRVYFGPVREPQFTNEVPQQKPIVVRPLLPDWTPLQGHPARGTLEFQASLEAQPVDARKNLLPAMTIPSPVAVPEREDGEWTGNLFVKLPEVALKGLYTGGRLKIAPVNPAYPRMPAPLLIPFRVVMVSSKYRLNRNAEPIVLNYSRTNVAPAVSESLQVVIFKHEGGLTVSIPESPGFGDKELWLQREGEPAAPEASRRKTLKLASPRETFKIWFQPSKTHIPGFWPFTLDIKLDDRVASANYDYDPRYSLVHLNFDPPKILASPETFHIQRGSVQTAALKVGLQGTSEGVHKIGLQFGTEQDNPTDPKILDGQIRTSYPGFRFQPDAQHASVDISNLDFEPLDSLSLKAVASPQLEPLRIKIDASKVAECGKYTLANGSLAADPADRIEPRPLEVVVEVDDLEAIDQKDVPLTNVLFFYPIKGKPLVKEVRVFAVKGKLTPEKLRVGVGKDQPFLNVNDASANPRIRLKVDKEPCTHPVDRQRAGVLVKMEFQDVEPSFVQYSGKITIASDELNLARTYDCAVQQVELRRPKNEPVKP